MFKAADILSGVLHDRAERPRAARRREVVNNAAAGQSVRGQPRAAARSRSPGCNPQRVSHRPPGEPPAAASTPNRTAPLEGLNISVIDGRAQRPRTPKSPSNVMKPSAHGSKDWLAHRGFGGRDWASQARVIVCYSRSSRRTRLRIDGTADLQKNK
jgi:hypothetical protein